MHPTESQRLRVEAALKEVGYPTATCTIVPIVFPPYEQLIIHFSPSDAPPTHAARKLIAHRAFFLAGAAWRCYDCLVAIPDVPSGDCTHDVTWV